MFKRLTQTAAQFFAHTQERRSAPAPTLESILPPTLHTSPTRNTDGTTSTLSAERADSGWWHVSDLRDGKTTTLTSCPTDKMIDLLSKHQLSAINQRQDDLKIEEIYAYSDLRYPSRKDALHILEIVRKVTNPQIEAPHFEHLAKLEDRYQRDLSTKLALSFEEIRCCQVVGP